MLAKALNADPKREFGCQKDSDLAFHSAYKQKSLSPCLDIHDFDGNLVSNANNGQYAACVSGKQAILQNPPQHLGGGSQVEVLSQDSGLRGCWFRALIIKRHKDKVKVQYQDIKDGDNETNNLEVKTPVVLSSPFFCPRA